ncbi:MULTISPECIES: ABC transporter permease [unclassified Bosea (in: a-proteobacteria)]|uniref:ABC transporter permease n=1 Tax=unclassified Bosea (in: a-proteobacteria) TaxID=2653178 RepID=UPI000F7577D2|nr:MULTISPECIES: ABC transporter permease [unclassified Bosea (in: a-proteobacteria)]AZO79739.1 sugar ABC transporter permease [Bosea sp. Tri-49]RXT16008.1 sugar ABC transporter permease [Bosea sp. Tri-39]RXT39700.1 sugar ABC transporter permease [Bosea sp. Tri-54]
MEIVQTLAVILDSTIRLSIPLLCAALAGLWSERSGVVDIGLEGKMLIAAFASAVVAYHSGSAWAGLGAGMLAAIALSLVHGFAAITWRGNQIVSGVAINMLAVGLTAILGNAWYGQGGRTPNLEGSARFPELDLPLVGAIKGIPILGPIYDIAISGHTAPVYLAVLALVLTALTLKHTRFGLRLRAVGENPAAVDTAGVSVAGLRYAAVIICGALCGLGGTYLAVSQSAGFLPQMTAGKGFIALAAVIFANWRPWPALFACLLFGLLDAVAIRLQGVVLPGIGQVPVQAIQALPYVMTVVLLAGFIGRATPPKASGLPYVKER